MKNGEKKVQIGEINPESGEINDQSGEIKITKLIIRYLGIKRKALAEQTNIALRTVDRMLKRLDSADKIEYRGSNKSGGWFPKT